LERQFDHLAAYFNTDTSSLTPPAVESEEATIFFDADHYIQEFQQEFQQDAQPLTPQEPPIELEVYTQSLHPLRQCPPESGFTETVVESQESAVDQAANQAAEFQIFDSDSDIMELYPKRAKQGG